MKSFLSEYGFAILSTVVVILIIMMISPVGNSVKEALKGTVIKFSGSAENGLDNIPAFDFYNTSNQTTFDGSVYSGDLFFGPMGYLYVVSSDDTNFCFYEGSISDIDEMIELQEEPSECIPEEMLLDAVENGYVFFIMHNYEPGVQVDNSNLFSVNNNDLLFYEDTYFWVNISGDVYTFISVRVTDTLDDGSIKGTVNMRDSFFMSEQDINYLPFQYDDLRLIKSNWSPDSYEQITVKAGDIVFIDGTSYSFHVDAVCGDKVILKEIGHLNTVSTGFFQVVSAARPASCSLTGVPKNSISYDYLTGVFKIDITLFDISYKDVYGNISSGRIQVSESCNDKNVCSKTYSFNGDPYISFKIYDGSIMAYHPTEQ